MSTWEDDDFLMAELTNALAEGRGVSDRSREAARAAYAWRTIDEELMALGHDSLQLEGSLVRGPGTAARVVSFQGRGFTLELEIDGGRLLGQVVPGQACSISVQSPDGAAHRVQTDPSGFFSLDAVGVGPRRFVVELEGATQTSEWLVV